MSATLNDEIEISLRFYFVSIFQIAVSFNTLLSGAVVMTDSSKEFIWFVS